MDVFRKCTRTFTAINKWVAYFALVIMMFSVTFYALSRALGKPIVGDVELVQFTMVLTILGSLAYTQSTKSHISVGIIADRFPLKIQKVIDVVANFLVFIFCTFVAYVFVAKLNFNQTSSLLNIPFWPFKLLLAIGFIGWSLEALKHILEKVTK